MENALYLKSRYRKYYQKFTPLLKERRIQAYTMVILSLFSISFFGMLAVRPTLKTITVLQKQIEDRTVLNQKLEEKINALIQAQEAYQQIEGDIPLIYTLLPENPEITSLLIRMESVLADTQVTVTAIHFDPIVIYGNQPEVTTEEVTEEVPTNVLAETASNTSAFSFTISYVGSYEELRTVLARLTSLERIITIRTADLKIGDIETSSVLTLGMQTDAHYYPLEL